VGFNAGHSAAVLLASFPRARVASFDSCVHPYTVPNFEWLVERFGPERLSLRCGDSRSTLPAAVAADASVAGEKTETLGSDFQPGKARAAGIDGLSELADIVRIDGGHQFPVAAADILNGKALAKPGALMMLDDCGWPEVWAAWQFAIARGVLASERPGLGWGHSCIGRYL
jgi:hypothetical protein